MVLSICSGGRINYRKGFRDQVYKIIVCSTITRQIVCDGIKMFYGGGKRARRFRTRKTPTFNYCEGWRLTYIKDNIGESIASARLVNLHGKLQIGDRL